MTDVLNEDGYSLDISHYSDELSINLEAPMELGTFTWPVGTAGRQIPAPKSTVGKFSFEYDDNFFLYVGDTSCLAADELWERVENAVIDPPSVRHPIRDWLQSMRSTFSRRRPGESDAERHVRNNREVSSDIPSTPPPKPNPPPLPVNTLRGT